MARCIVQAVQHTPLLTAYRPGRALPPLLFDRHLPPSTRLEVGMMGGRGSAPWSVIEQCIGRHRLGQPQQVVQTSLDTLRLVLSVGNGQMLRKDGIGIQQNIILFLPTDARLAGRAILSAEETGSVTYAGFVHPRTCRDDAGRVVLQQVGRTVHLHPSRLHSGQGIVPLPCLRPLRQLTLPPLLHIDAGGSSVRRLSVPAHPCLQFPGTDAVLVQVPPVGQLAAGSRIAVALPASAQVERFVHTSYPVFTTDAQTHGIVLAVAGVGQVQPTQQRCVEGTRSTQPVDAQGVVASVFLRPFPVVYHPRRQRVQLEVRQPVAAHHHGTPLLVEGLHHRAERVRAAVEVVTVQLYRKLATQPVVYRLVPTSAYAQTRACRHQVYHPCILRCPLADDLRGAVGRVIVHHYHVEGKRSLLTECRAYGIADGAHAVAHRYDDRCLADPLHPVRLQTDLAEARFQIAPYGLQMAGAYALHLQLALAVARIHVGKVLCLAGGLHIRHPLHHRIERLVHTQWQAASAQAQAQVVQGGPAVRFVHPCHLLLQPVGTQQPQRAEVKIVAQRTLLVVDDGHLHPAAIRPLQAVVCIEQIGTACFGYVRHTLQYVGSRLYGLNTHTEQCIGRSGCIGHGAQRGGGIEGFMHHVDLMHHRTGHPRFPVPSVCLLAVVRQKTCNHFFSF